MYRSFSPASACGLLLLASFGSAQVASPIPAAATPAAATPAAPVVAVGAPVAVPSSNVAATTPVAAVTAAAVAPTCFSLAGTSVCTPWASFSVATSDGFYTDLASFDQYVRSQFDNSTAYLNSFDGGSCPSYHGGTARYHISLVCGTLVDASTFNGICNAATPAIAASVPRLCKSTGATAITTLQTVLSDPANGCPANSTTTAPAYLPYDTYAGRLISNSNCVAAIPTEWQTCGFWTNDEVAQYCAAGAATATDSCCTAYAARLANQPIVVPTSLVAAGAGTSPVSSSATSPSPGVTASSNSSGTVGASQNAGQGYGAPTTTIIIIACVVAAALAIGIIAAIYYARRRNVSRRAPDGFLQASSASSRDGSLKYNRGADMARAPASFADPATMERNGTINGQQFQQQQYQNQPHQGQTQNVPGGAGAMAAAAMMGVENEKEDVGEPIQIAETMEVLYNYVPNLVDEIYLYVGDPVIVKCKFDDGWGFGFNMTTKQEGSFPLACVAPYNSGANSNAQQQNRAADVPTSTTPSPPMPPSMDEHGWKDTLDSQRRASSLGRLTPLAPSPHAGQHSGPTSPLSRNQEDDNDVEADYSRGLSQAFDGQGDQPTRMAARQTYAPPPQPYHGTYESYR
ncbi:hypothetical protein HKX48_000539 [Thoreauomyces humboldtii]|nr:hypothetical protein HKX48_000539 [Thoreauomyces humboldtii]